MAALTLLHTLHNEAANRALRAMVAAFEAAFPGRVDGYYLQGSFADASDVSASDLDVVLLVAEAADEAERAAMAHLAGQLTDEAEIELDIEVKAVERSGPGRGVAPNLKLGSVLIYGEDTRADLPLVPIEVWARDRMHSSYWRVAKLYPRPAVIVPPVAYPDPSGEFYGYDRRLLRLKDGREVPCTRDLIRLTSWAATARLANECGVYVARKSECHVLYRRHIGDQWASLLDDIYTLCRQRWSYLIPDDPVERAQLRALCARTLDFENDFLGVYARYAAGELRSGDADALDAVLRFLQMIPFGDAEVLAALTELEQRDGGDSGMRARAILAAMETA